MTTEPGGSARTARVAGLSLLAVAAAAAVIGVITLIDGGGGDDNTAAPPPVTSAPATHPTTSPPTTGDLTSSPPTATTTSGPGVPTTTSLPPVVTSTVVPSTVVPSPGTSASGQVREPLRIYNNSMIQGLAARAAQEIGAEGWPVDEIGAYSSGNIPTTTVYWQAGTGQEAAARELAQEFGFRAEERFDGIKGARPGLILIVTNDYRVDKDNK
ncbi:LytR C-terminal domain-containing protein [Actinokineospora enzanensis]|uniref:LytR C-terminal domain-containing protein n=1 Tax=Actinokineospora enzanensis TaxID=155975 RepID=UPI00037BA16D|nr:LytR C-terminal domain-containing protein [Actinokineospora enzanensis]